MKQKINRSTNTPGIKLYNPEDPKPRYYLQFRYGKDPLTGKSNTIKKMVDSDGSHLTTIKRAKAYMEELKSEYDKDHSTNFNNQMLYSTFMDNFYIPYYKTDVQSSTYTTRENTLQIIRNRFGHLKLKDITPPIVQEFRTFLLSSKKDGGSGYSQSYASLVFGMFRKTLDQAVTLGYLETNVSKKVKPIPKGKVKVPYWTKEEFQKVISQIYIKDYYQHLTFIMLWIYFTTGVRVNEGCALYWDDVNFKKKTLSIRHTLDIKNKNEWIRKDTTKTENGLRTISLDDDSIQILKEWKKCQDEHCQTKFIFSYDGKPMLKSTISRIIERYAKLAGIHKIQAKGLRHSHASYLINEFNIDILMLSRRLGHSSPEITLKHYSHLYPVRDNEIANHITGNIKRETSNENHIQFNGNQAIKK